MTCSSQSLSGATRIAATCAALDRSSMRKKTMNRVVPHAPRVSTAKKSTLAGGHGKVHLSFSRGPAGARARRSG